MPHPLPLRETWTLTEAAQHWHVDEAELGHWLVQGHLKAHVWVPLMSVFLHLGPDQSPRLCHWEGYVPLSRHYCLRLFRRWEIRLRDFTGQDQQQQFLLPHSADDLVVTISDLVILEPDRLRWEERWGAERARGQAASTSRDFVTAMPSFRRVSLGGEEHQFGLVQAAALRLLHDAARSGEPWLNGKQLLREAGSQSYTLSNLFKRKPVWRELIRSDGRGFYRLRESFLREFNRMSPVVGDRSDPAGSPPPPPRRRFSAPARPEAGFHAKVPEGPCLEG
jgi:hypothetical protein